VSFIHRVSIYYSGPNAIWPGPPFFIYRRYILYREFCASSAFLSSSFSAFQTYNYMHINLMALLTVLSRWASTRKVKTIHGFYWSKRQWVAVASAGDMLVCTSLQTDNHASSPPLRVLQGGCPSCRPTNSITALKAVQGKPTLASLLLIKLHKILTNFQLMTPLLLTSLVSL